MPGDTSIVELFDRLHGTVLDPFFTTVTGLPFRLVVLFAALLVAYLVTRTLRSILAVAIAVPLTLIVTAIIKAATDRVRPAIADSALSPLVPIPGDGSFPSGHTSTAFAAAAALAIFMPRLRWLLFVAPVLIAVSRVWVGVHYPSDVLVGAALGLVMGLAVGALVRR